MNLICFGSGSPMSLTAAEALRRAGGLSLIVVPRKATGRNPLLRFARRHGISLLDTSEPLVVQRSIRELGIALICCATFPEKIPVSILEASSGGGINLHPSLLPRHRGVDPIFWTYVTDDRETGVTIHRMTDRIDEGEILDQTVIPLERGRSCGDLYEELGRIGAARMVELVRRLRAGEPAIGVVEQEGGSAEPAPAKAGFAVPFGEWPAERVWHVLSGLGERYHELLRDANGRTVLHGRAGSAGGAVGRLTPGKLEASGPDLLVHCRDGLVRVSRWRRKGIGRRVVDRFARMLGCASGAE